MSEYEKLPNTTPQNLALTQIFVKIQENEHTPGYVHHKRNSSSDAPMFFLYLLLICLLIMYYAYKIIQVLQSAAIPMHRVWANSSK